LKLSQKKKIGETTKPKSEIRINSKGLGIPDPIYVVDGKVVEKNDVSKLDKGIVEKISVLKGEKAIEKYGDKGKNGVVEFFLKK